MNPPIVDSAAPITLVGGGPCTIEELERARALAPRVIAVDGGLALCQAAGVVPERVVGDMDSVEPQALAALPEAQRLRIAEQDSTDFDKALRVIRAPLIVGIGFLGARLDHTLATLHGMAARPDQAVLLLGDPDCAFLCPPHLRLEIPSGTRLSLFPLGDTTGRSTGLRWPIDGITFAPALQIGTSNEALGPVSLTMDTPGMITILPRAHVMAAAQALLAAEAWPARARL